MRTIRAACVIAVAVALAAVLSACRLPFAIGGQAAPGAIEISVGPDATRSLRPDLPEPTVYSVTGLGPEGASFSESVASFPAGYETLIPGEWTISVEGYGGAGMLLLEGTATVVVYPSTTSRIMVSLWT